MTGMRTARYATAKGTRRSCALRVVELVDLVRFLSNELRDAEMVIADLIQEVESLTEPSRDIDVKIGLLVGWQRKVEYANEKEENSRNVIWILHGERTARLPRFTDSLEAALQLLELVAPKYIGGVSWSTDECGFEATAIVNNGDYCHGATPALAVCLAALKIKQSQLEDD